MRKMGGKNPSRWETIVDWQKVTLNDSNPPYTSFKDYDVNGDRDYRVEFFGNIRGRDSKVNGFGRIWVGLISGNNWYDTVIYKAESSNSETNETEWNAILPLIENNSYQHVYGFVDILTGNGSNIHLVKGEAMYSPYDSTDYLYHIKGHGVHSLFTDRIERIYLEIQSYFNGWVRILGGEEI